MWTNENRARYDRSHLRYPSDLTDAEWKLVELLIPPGKRCGDKRTVIMREIVNGQSAEKGGLRLIRRATTRERRSRARSGIFSSIRKAC
jgi:transposase